MQNRYRWWARLIRPFGPPVRERAGFHQAESSSRTFSFGKWPCTWEVRSTTVKCGTVSTREDRVRIPALHSHVTRANGAQTKRIRTYGANPAWQRGGDFWGDDQKPLVRSKSANSTLCELVIWRKTAGKSKEQPVTSNPRKKTSMHTLDLLTFFEFIEFTLAIFIKNTINLSHAPD